MPKIKMKSKEAAGGSSSTAAHWQATQIDKQWDLYSM